jgi:hypothetical protein
VLGYYDLRAMTMSMLMGLGIVTATMLCHSADRVRPLHLGWDMRVGATSYPPEDLVGVDLIPSFDGAEVIRLEMPHPR